MTLNKGQLEAVDTFLQFILNPDKKALVLTGSPGCGKTFLTKFLLDNLPNQMRLAEALGAKAIKEVVCTATTHKAADELAKALGKPTTTIHKALGISPQVDYTTGKTRYRKTSSYGMSYNTLLLIDEASMIDSDLYDLIKQATHNCKLVFIGDKDQLPPVFEAISRCFLETPDYIELTEPMRFTGKIGELVKQLKETVNTGVFKPMQEHKGIIDYLTPDEAQDYISTHFGSSYVEGAHKIVAYSNNQVVNYIDYIREELQQLPKEWQVGEPIVISKFVKSISGLSTYHAEFSTTITSVDYDNLCEIHNVSLACITIATGDSLYIPVNPDELARAKKYYSKNKDWVEFYWLEENVADIRSSHACTVHKSQGSTYDEIFIDLGNIGTCRNPRDVARLLYVAVSRAKHRVVFYGELPAKYQNSKEPLFEPVKVLNHDSPRI